MKKRPLLLAASLVQLLFAAAVDSQTAERISAAAENDAVDALPRTAFYETDAAIAFLPRRLHGPRSLGSPHRGWPWGIPRAVRLSGASLRRWPRYMTRLIVGP
jgi:hypothetical protein